MGAAVNRVVVRTLKSSAVEVSGAHTIRARWFNLFLGFNGVPSVRLEKTLLWGLCHSQLSEVVLIWN